LHRGRRPYMAQRTERPAIYRCRGSTAFECGNRPCGRFANRGGARICEVGSREGPLRATWTRARAKIPAGKEDHSQSQRGPMGSKGTSTRHAHTDLAPRRRRAQAAAGSARELDWCRAAAMPAPCREFVAAPRLPCALRGSGASYCGSQSGPTCLPDSRQAGARSPLRYRREQTNENCLFSKRYNQDVGRMMRLAVSALKRGGFGGGSLPPWLCEHM
jgi:hypothetical protein